MSSGGSYTPANTGVYVGQFSSDQSNGWDVSVSGTASGYGRIWSVLWGFDAGTYASSDATNGSFYALVPAGPNDEDTVIELKAQGLAGYVYEIGANSYETREY